MMRSIVLGVVVLLAVVTLVATAGLPQGNPNAFIVLYFVELPLVPAAGVLGLAVLLIRPGSAPGLVGAGSYALLVGAAFALVIPFWNPSDNAFLGLALLGALMAGVGGGLTLAGSLVLGGRELPQAVLAGAIGGLVSGFIVLAGGVVYPAAVVRAPLLVPLVIIPLAVWLTGPRRGELTRPLIAAGLAAIVTIAAFLMRGEGDWATASRTVKLYSFPTVVLALALAALIYELGSTRARPHASPEPR